MSDQRKTALETIAAFDRRLRRKDAHLMALKELIVTLDTTEDEESFALKALPLLKEATDALANPSLIVRVGGTVVAVPRDQAAVLEAHWARARAEHGLARSTVVLGAATEAADCRAGGPVCALVPIYHGTTDMGLMCFARRDAVPPDNDDEVFLRYIGEVLGIFFHYVMLRKDLVAARKEMEARYDDLLAVYAVAQVLGGNLDLQEVLEKGLDTILQQDVLSVQAKGGIFLVNEETNCLDMVCQRNIGEALARAEQTIPFGHCLCGLAAQTGETVVSQDCFADDRHHTHYPGMAAHGHIILPLKSKDKLLGVLFLYLPPGVHASPRQVETVKAIANQLAVSVENARLYERVKHLSIRDPLTGLLNRSALYDRLEEERNRSRRFGETLGVAMMDIDYFKRVNDHYGHLAGDRVLQQVAAELKKNLRGCDVAARYSGDEFVLILPHTNRQGVVTALDRIHASVTHTVSADALDASTPITMSTGLAFAEPEDRSPATELIDAADRALYRAKREGRNRIVVAGPETSAEAQA